MYAFIKKLGSLAKKMLYSWQGVLYSYKEKNGKPIKLYFPPKTAICLHPQGQIAKLLYTRQFEQHEINLVINYLKPGMNAVDIGANIGLYSLIADKFISPLGKVWAFEPSTENFDRLVANVSLNKAVTVNAVQLALGDVDDKMVELRRDPGLGDAERYLELQQGQKYTRNAQGDDDGDAEQVEVTTLDSYLYKELESPPKIDFMKLDVEGGELRVFHGARRTLTDNPNMMIFFECFTLWCERAGSSPDEVFKYLRTFGFEIYAMNKNSHQWESNNEIINTAINVWACRHKSMLPRIS